MTRSRVLTIVPNITLAVSASRYLRLGGWRSKVDER
jgi:hypothetical protein